MDKAVDNANARANQGNKDEAKNQLIVGNSTNKLTDPSDGASDPRTDIGKHGRNGISGRSSLKNHTFLKKLFNIH